MHQRLGITVGFGQRQRPAAPVQRGTLRGIKQVQLGQHRVGHCQAVRPTQRFQPLDGLARQRLACAHVASQEQRARQSTLRPRHGRALAKFAVQLDRLGVGGPRRLKRVAQLVLQRQLHQQLGTQGWRDGLAQRQREQSRGATVVAGAGGFIGHLRGQLKQRVCQACAFGVVQAAHRGRAAKLFEQARV